jgi:hypothetical protein
MYTVQCTAMKGVLNHHTGEKASVLVSIHQVVHVENGRHVEEGLELGPHPPVEQVLLLV